MHAHDLLNIAPVIAWYGPALIHAPAALPDNAIEEYWSASKCRLDRWGTELRTIRDKFAVKFGFDAPTWRAVSALCDEILTGEIVTRLWTAVIALHDRKRQVTESEPIARSVLIGHLEARHRVLNLILNYTGVGPHEAVVLNRLRHRCERWTDILLARIGDSRELRDLAHDAERVDDFHQEWPQQNSPLQPTEQSAWLLATFAAAFVKHPTATANADLNARIARGMIAAFPPEMFSDVGLVLPVWFQQLRTGQVDQPGRKQTISAGKTGSLNSLESAGESLHWWQQMFPQQQMPRQQWPGSNRWDALN